MALRRRTVPAAKEVFHVSLGADGSHYQASDSLEVGEADLLFYVSGENLHYAEGRMHSASWTNHVKAHLNTDILLI